MLDACGGFGVGGDRGLLGLHDLEAGVVDVPSRECEFLGAVLLGGILYLVHVVQPVALQGFFSVSVGLLYA